MGRKNKRNINKHKSLNRDELKNIKLYPALKNTKEGQIYGYINESGNFVIDPKFNRAYDFNDYGVAIVVVDNEKYGLINKKGEYILKPTYNSISQYKDGRAVFVKDNEMGVLDESGNKITTKSYNFINDYNNDLAVVGINKNDGSYYYGYIDKDGNEIVTPQYLQANDFVDEFALVKINEAKYGLINKMGDLINTYNYQYVSNYGEGLMVFGKSFSGPLGYLNKEGQEVIKPTFTAATEFKDGLAVVSLEEKFNGPYGAINKDGKYVYQPIYSRINSLGDKRFALGMPIGEDKYTLTSIYAIGDNIGNKLTDFNYLVVGTYTDGLAYASNEEYTFFIDKNGDIKRNLPYVKGSGMLSVKDNLIYADIDYSPYYINKIGKVIYMPNLVIKLDNKYSVLKKKYKPNINYLIYYPEVQGVINKNVKNDINAKLKEISYFKPIGEDGQPTNKEISSEDILNYSYLGNFSVTFFKKNLLVLELTGYYYPFGAAHGMPSKKTPNINLVTGKFYTLGDLFMGGVYWVGELNKIIEEMIKTDKQYEYVYPDGFKGIEPNQNFYVDEENLYIYFYPYDIAPYAAGFVTFKIPFSEISGMINKQGEFYKSFN